MIVALVMASCDMFNVDVETTMKGTLDIQVDEDMAKSTLQLHHFHAVDTLNPQEDQEVKDYKDNIVAVGVGNITAEVISVTRNGEPVEDVVVKTGSTITVGDAGNEAVWHLNEDWEIVEEAVFMLDDQEGFYDEVSSILDDVEKFYLEMEGDATVPGVSIVLEFSIEATVTGSIF